MAMSFCGGIVKVIQRCWINGEYLLMFSKRKLRRFETKHYFN